MSDTIKLTGTTVLVDVGVDTSSSTFSTGLQALAQQAVNSGIPKVVITVDKIDATKALAGFKSQLETIANSMGLKYGSTINTKTSSGKSGPAGFSQEQKANQLADLEKRLSKAGVHSDELKAKIHSLSAELNSLNDAGIDKWTASFKDVQREVDNLIHKQRILAKASKDMDSFKGNERLYRSGKYPQSAELTKLYEQANKLKSAFHDIDPLEWNVAEAQEFSRILGFDPKLEANVRQSKPAVRK